MRNGRNDKVIPMGFDNAARTFTHGLSSEAAANFLTLVRDVASQYHYNDAAAIKNLRNRLRTAARRNRTRAWANEVLDLLANHKKATLEGAAA